MPFYPAMSPLLPAMSPLLPSNGDDASQGRKQWVTSPKLYSSHRLPLGGTNLFSLVSTSKKNPGERCWLFQPGSGGQPWIPRKHRCGHGRPTWGVASPLPSTIHWIYTWHVIGVLGGLIWVNKQETKSKNKQETEKRFVSSNLRGSGAGTLKPHLVI